MAAWEAGGYVRVGPSCILPSNYARRWFNCAPFNKRAEMTLAEKVRMLRWLRRHGFRLQSYRLFCEIEAEAPGASSP
jgi:hypothetical protein